MAKHERSKFRIYIEFAPFWLLYRVMHFVPLGKAYAFGEFLFSLLFIVDFKHRERAIDHILHAGIVSTRKEAYAMARKSFTEFSKLLVEIVKMDQCYKPEKINIIGSKPAIDYALSKEGKNQNVIIITAHYGNWEIAGTAFSDASRNNMLSIMRPFDNPLVGEMILKNRRSKVHELVNKKVSIKPVLKALSEGLNISVLIDQHASSKESVETVFFGQPCNTHMTPALLHLKTGVPILPAVIRRKGRDFEFDLVVGDLIKYSSTGDKPEDIRNITQMCTTALEKLIAEEPVQWMWAPRRWLNMNRGKYTPKTDIPETESDND